jgi:hypothetical protein
MYNVGISLLSKLAGDWLVLRHTVRVKVTRCPPWL